MLTARFFRKSTRKVYSKQLKKKKAAKNAAHETINTVNTSLKNSSVHEQSFSKLMLQVTATGW